MASTEMQGRTLAARARSAWSAWLLALLLVLQSVVPLAHHLSSGTTRPLLAALVSEGDPTLRPVGHSGQAPSVRSEARPLAGPPDRAFEQDPPAALPPVAAASAAAWIGAPPPHRAGDHPRPRTGRAFAARAPPAMA
jgi:hypothetical protein